MKVQVLYEDNHLIAVFKPAGILIQSDVKNGSCLMEDVKQFLKEKYSKPGKVFLGLIHRLDRNVSGVVLFAKTSKGAARLSEQFRNKTVTKIYHATVEGILLKKKAVLKNFLLKNKTTNKVSVVKEGTDGALFAELEYEVLREEKGFSFLEIRLKTGRPHQIRVQLAAIGHPIKGDQKYGSKFNGSNKIELCAVSLSFTTAVSGESITVKIN
jgi:23S rRNA pseudouridine1911/1915/1917 synthase